MKLNGRIRPVQIYFEQLHRTISGSEVHFNLANKEKRVEELEREMEAPDFWDNPERSQKMMKELSTQIASFQLGNAAAVTVMRKGRDGYTSLEYQVTVRGR